MEVDLWGVSTVILKALGYGGSLIAAGSVLFLLALRPVDAVAGTTRRAGLVGLSLGFAATLAFLAVQAGYLMGDGLAGLLDAFALGLVIDGPLGQAAGFRLTGLALIAIALLIPALRWLLGVMGALLVGLSFALAGHANAEPRLLLSGLITLHVLGICFWVGALWPLYKATRLSGLEEAADLAHRFGNQAMVVVPTLILAGGLFVALRVDPLSALFGSAYGLSLAVKLLMVGGLLLLAQHNRTRAVPAMRAGNPDGAHSLRRTIAWEASAFAAILVITAWLTTITPIPGGAH